MFECMSVRIWVCVWVCVWVHVQVESVYIKNNNYVFQE